MKIFAFVYNPMIEESATATISLHLTKKGAEMAMEFHKAEIRKQWEKHDKITRERYKDDYELYKGSEFGLWEYWGVEEVEVLP